ncbi:MAG: hypothetical protein K8R88_14380 [Armatimonadetes bacterium]|nr:hypothetical protein [Armatimonadota bacterium]
MKNEFYKKLIDMYAGDELSSELKDELETAALSDSELSHEMFSLKTTVEALRSSPEPEFTDDTFQRILMRMYRQGVDVKTHMPESPHMQLRLPLTG